MGSPKNLPIWTKESCLEEALKYKTRSDFHKSSSGCYDAAQKNGWREEACAHMIKLKTRRDKRNCIKVALKYKTRGEFVKLSKGFYAAARRNGWLDEVCAHMPKRVTRAKNKS